MGSKTTNVVSIDQKHSSISFLFSGNTTQITITVDNIASYTAFQLSSTRFPVLIIIRKLLENYSISMWNDPKIRALRESALRTQKSQGNIVAPTDDSQWSGNRSVKKFVSYGKKLDIRYFAFALLFIFAKFELSFRMNKERQKERGKSE